MVFGGNPLSQQPSGGYAGTVRGEGGDGPVATTVKQNQIELQRRLLPSVGERARVGLVFLAVALTVLIAVDLAVLGLRAPLLTAMEALRVLVFLGLAVFLRSRRSETAESLATLVGITTLAATSAVIAPIRGELGPYMIVSVGLALGCASGIPWTVGYQAAATVILSAGLAADYWVLSGKPGALATPNSAFAFGMNMLVSIYVTWLEERRRRAAMETFAETERADEALRALNQQLESRVEERTLALAEANRELQASNRSLATTNRDLEEAYRELEGFTHSVSHDLRVPLRVINGLSQVALEEHGTALGEDGRSYLGRIAEAAVRLGDIGDDLLLLARVTRAPMSPRRMDVSVMAHAIMAEQRAIDPGRDVEVAIEPGIFLDGDPGLLRIALENLLSNAWKFTRGRHEARIDVEAFRVDGQAGLRVRDNGIGFPAAFAGKLFKRFERVHDHPDIDGTGIGLAIVHRIVARHGGQVWAEGEDGRGAAFSLTLPIHHE